MDKIEKTFFIIKPEAFFDREKIKNFIRKNSDFKIVSSRILILEAKDIEKIYSDDIETPLLKLTKDHMIGREVEVGIIHGKNAIDNLIKLCGMHPNGKLCGNNTIRRKFNKDDPAKKGKTVYLLNAIHKASQGEVQNCLKWYYNKITELCGREK